jgi:hypothetical protein
MLRRLLLILTCFATLSAAQLATPNTATAQYYGYQPYCGYQTFYRQPYYMGEYGWYPRWGYAYPGAPFYRGYGPPYYSGSGPPYYPGYGPPYVNMFGP